MVTPIPTPIYHITHVSNLTKIIAYGCLYCHNILQGNGVTYTDISHESVQAKRADTLLPCGGNGRLLDYVPFYFSALSPMLYAIHKRRVAQYAGGEEEVVCLRSTAQAVAQRQLTFAFTNRHAVLDLAEFFDDLSHLNNINWAVIAAKYWLNFPDGRALRQAEFLVHQHFPLDLIDKIYVYNEQHKTSVMEALANSALTPEVIVHRGMYF